MAKRRIPTSSASNATELTVDEFELEDMFSKVNPEKIRKLEQRLTTERKEPPKPTNIQSSVDSAQGN